MKWLVGIDLTEGSAGSLHFGSWLARFSTGEGPEEIAGAHVLPAAAQIGAFMTNDQLGRLHPDAKAACLAAIEKAEASEAIPRVELSEADSIVEGLCSEAVSHGADALVVGRLAKKGEERLSRLGRVSRRLLRRLPTPVVVVPPDFKDDDARDGPVILATDCSDISVDAGKFAETMARRFDCELLVVHVVRELDWAVAYVPVDTLDQVRNSSKEVGRADLASWAQRHSLWGAQAEVLHGDPAQKIGEFARDKNASMIVCGSRQLATATRAFVPSVASELAASAWCPVAVVPQS